MAPILDSPTDHGLEGLCDGGDWVRARGPIEGVELLRAWFNGRGYAPHRHDTYAVGVTESGVQAFDYRGRVECSRAGQVVVLHPDETHDGRSGAEGGFGYRIVYVDPARVAEAARVIRGRPGPLPFVREPVSSNPLLVRTVNAAFGLPLEPLAIDDLVLSLTRGVLQVQSGADVDETDVGAPRRLDHAALARGRALLDSRQDVVRSADLEAATGLSRYELARQFRSVYGTSPHRYSLMRRLDFARTQLRQGVPLAELALCAGFADQAHFTRTFRSAYGMTPGRYARLQTA